MNLFEELEWRGLVDNITSPEVKDAINNEKLTFYIGTDPTADSLHIGHYSSLLMAKRLENTDIIQLCWLVELLDLLEIQRQLVKEIC